MTEEFVKGLITGLVIGSATTIGVGLGVQYYQKGKLALADGTGNRQAGETPENLDGTEESDSVIQGQDEEEAG